MLHTFTVPVKPHVAKYLCHHLGAGYKLSQLDVFGRHLKLLLQQKRENKYLDGFTGRYTAKFSVAVEGNLILQKRLRALNSKEIIDFNNFVEGIIKTEFHGMVAARAAFSLSQYAAIQEFRAKYDFQDQDITHEALKKSWQRYADENPEQPGRARPVPVSPPASRRLAA